MVDDNAENRALAEATLSERYHVVLAASGDEALAAFEREPPDCVLLDVRMPGMDGFLVSEQIRRLPSGAQTPILFLTALRDIDVFDRAVAAGAVDFLTKPIRPAELLVRVQTALRLSQIGRELREHVDLVRHHRDELLRVQLQKERLMGFVVHDLKTPVASIDVFAQLLLRNEELPEKAREAGRSIRGEARHLLRMIMNLLDITRAEEGRLEPRPAEFDLSAVIQDVVGALEPRANLTGVSLRVGVELDPPQLRADEELIRRVLENLVDNAIRHTPSGGSVSIGARPVEGGVELQVADTGDGVPAEIRDRIFDKYVQVESGHQSRTGRGLGLAFCRLAIEAHGGTIDLLDEGSGAVFSMRIPG